ncbi:MAG TPA: hypothetical protein VFC51_05545 [Chloroflexota bacterium]|nr:hypothetical protein [Chloroflexota bacterium]
MDSFRRITGLVAAIFSVGLLALQSGPVSGQAEPKVDQYVVTKVLPNGDVAGTVLKPAGTVVQGPLLAAPPSGPAVDKPLGRSAIADSGGSAPASQVAETRVGDVTTQASGTFVLKRDTALSPTSGTSNVNEPNVGVQGSTIFQTGNWYAAVSSNNGSTFSYIDPSTTFPEAPFAFSAGFCCDQRVAQDNSRDLVFWYLQYVKTGSTSTDTNGVRIAVAHGAGDLASNTWQMHDFTPADFGFGLGKWLDYPTLAVSNNFLYFTSNVFDTNATSSSMSVMARIPLDALRDNVSFTMNTLVNQSRFSVTPVSGATTTMFFGSVSGSTSVDVFRWPESDSSPTITTVSGLSGSSNATFSCTGPDNLDPCTRADRRMQTGWLNSTELGFMWDSASMTGRPFPFVRVLILNPSTLAIVSQPDMFSTSTAILYPAVAVNARGHIGGEVSVLGGSSLPTIEALIRDDFSPDVTTSGWEIHQVATSTNGTSGRWGDYTGAVAHDQFPNTWLAVGHVQQGGSANANVKPHNFWFMRERDDPGGVLPTSTPTPTGTILPTSTSAPSRTPTQTAAGTLTPLPNSSCSGSASDVRPMLRTSAPRHMTIVDTATAPMASARTTAQPLSTTPGFTTITCETFEGSWPTSSWLTFDNSAATFGNGLCWAPVAFQARFGSKSAWPAAGCSGALNPATSNYANNMDSWMIFGPFSLADAVDGDVRFSLWLQTEINFDYVYWGASIDGEEFQVTGLSGRSTTSEPPTANGWLDEVIDLKNAPALGNLMGEPVVYIAWIFQSDSSITDNGPFVDDVLIEKKVSAAATPTSPPPTSTSPVNTLVASPTRTQTRTPTATPTIGGAIGGRNLSITTNSSGVLLNWQPGGAQSGYLILRLANGVLSTLPTGGPLPSAATSFTDFNAPFGMDCYLLLPLGTSPQALSDVLCALVGFHTPSGSPQNFTLALNQSTTASLTWNGPFGGGQDSFLVQPIGGAGQVVAGSINSAQLPTNGMSCYAVGALSGPTLLGYTDILCGLPGVSNLATDSRAAARGALQVATPNRLGSRGGP